MDSRQPLSAAEDADLANALPASPADQPKTDDFERGFTRFIEELYGPRNGEPLDLLTDRGI